MGRVAEVESARGVTDRTNVLDIPKPRTRTVGLGEWMLKRGAVVVADVLVIGVVSVIVGGSFRPAGDPLLYAIAFALIGALALAYLRLRRLWAVGIELSVLDETPGLIVAGLLPSILVYFMVAMVAPAESVWPFVYLAAAVTGGLLLERAFLRALQRYLRRRGIGLRNTLIVGAGNIGTLISRRLLFNREHGLLPVGFVDKEPLTDAAERLGLPVLGNSRDLPRLIHDYDVGMVVLAFSTAPHEVLLRVVATCQERGVQLTVVPRLFETITHPGAFERMRGIPVIQVGHIRLSGGLWWTKRMIDLVGSAFLLAVSAPLLVALAAYVKLDTPGPVFYRQERVGRDGRPFFMIKFRTLAADAEKRQGEAMWSDSVESGAGRDLVTRAGRILRRSSLDELPQLLNVFKGDMSLVGPRPERPVFVNRFVHDIYRYGDRMRVKVGMTGWAQVHGLKGNNGSLAERVEYDNHYIENWSPWLDVRIILLTIQQIYRDLRGIGQQ
ncbi:MAG: sugar transferase [Thermoleophilia bacterium]